MSVFLFYLCDIFLYYNDTKPFPRQIIILLYIVYKKTTYSYKKNTFSYKKELYLKWRVILLKVIKVEV